MLRKIFTNYDKLQTAMVFNDWRFPTLSPSAEKSSRFFFSLVAQRRNQKPSHSFPLSFFLLICGFCSTGLLSICRAEKLIYSYFTDPFNLPYPASLLLVCRFFQSSIIILLSVIIIIFLPAHHLNIGNCFIMLIDCAQLIHNLNIWKISFLTYMI